MSILDAIIQNKIAEVAMNKSKVSLQELKEKIQKQEPARDFLGSLRKKAPLSIIAECKQRSPSKGTLISPYVPETIAKSYEDGGAAAISVLTDGVFFGGTLEDIRKVRQKTSIPILRKDFIIDEYQIFESRAWGADSFLLIAGVLDLQTIDQYIHLGRTLGMEPLIESHTEKELELAAHSQGTIIGVNNRNLSSFDVDLKKSAIALSHIDTTKNKDHSLSRLFVCESGIHSWKDVLTMKNLGFSAFLVGESLIKSPDPLKKIKELQGENP